MSIGSINWGFSKSGYFSSVYYQQCFLVAGKYDKECIPIVLPEQKHVELDCWGFWRVASYTVLLGVAECFLKCRPANLAK